MSETGDIARALLADGWTVEPGPEPGEIIFTPPDDDDDHEEVSP